VEGPHCVQILQILIQQTEGPENFWNFDSSRLAKSALLFFHLKEKKGGVAYNSFLSEKVEFP